MKLIYLNKLKILPFESFTKKKKRLQTYHDLERLDIL